MRFEYRHHEKTVEVWLTHSTGDRLIGTLRFDEDGTSEFLLWTTTMTWNSLHVLVPGIAAAAPDDD